LPLEEQRGEERRGRAKLSAPLIITPGHGGGGGGDGGGGGRVKGGARFRVV